MLYMMMVRIVVDGGHFLGGTITYRPLNVSATGSPIAILITQTYSWLYSNAPCTNTLISNSSLIPVNPSLNGEKLKCIESCGAGATGYTNVSVWPVCTDASVPIGTTGSQRTDIVYLDSGDDFSAAFMGGHWRSLATVASGDWSLAAHFKIQPRSDNGLYNNAPITTVISPVYVPFNQTMAIHLPVTDADGDVVRCRWANKSNGIDECSSVCPPSSSPPNTKLFPNCTIITTGKNLSDWYAIAVMASSLRHEHF